MKVACGQGGLFESMSEVSQIWRDHFLKEMGEWVEEVRSGGEVGLAAGEALGRERGGERTSYIWSRGRKHLLPSQGKRRKERRGHRCFMVLKEASRLRGTQVGISDRQLTSEREGGKPWLTFSALHHGQPASRREKSGTFPEEEEVDRRRVFLSVQPGSRTMGCVGMDGG